MGIGKNRRTARLAVRATLSLGALAGAGLTPGCNLVHPPALAPTPAPVPTPKPDLFDPKDGVTTLAPLNDNDPSNNSTGGLSDKFRVINIPSGELLQLQSLTGAPGKYIGGSSDLYRLAGVLTPAQGQPGYAEVVRFIAERTLGAGNEVDVEQDPRFPQDLDGHRMVQVFYTPTVGSRKGEKLLLNRMMVRQGFAVVDINAPTSIDVRSWLNDEEFARTKRLGLNALGITIGQRIPLDTPGGVIRTPVQRIPPGRGPGGRPGGRPGVRPGARPGGPPGTRTTTTTTTSTSVNSAPGASRGPNGTPNSTPNGTQSGSPPGGRGGPPRGAGGPPPRTPGGPGGPPPGGRGGPPPGPGGPRPGMGGPPRGGQPGGPPPGAASTNAPRASSAAPATR